MLHSKSEKSLVNNLGKKHGCKKGIYQKNARLNDCSSLQSKFMKLLVFTTLMLIKTVIISLKYSWVIHIRLIIKGTMSTTFSIGVINLK